jgi:hypothetical protein
MQSSNPTRRADRAVVLGAGRAVVGAALAVTLAACEPVPVVERPEAPLPSSPALEPSGPPLSFEYRNVAGGTVSADDLRDRLTIIVFGTTYDVPSQAQAKFLAQVHRDHVPRINALLLVLEQPENEILVAAYASALSLRYPVAMADSATIKGAGPFPGLRHVPSVVILDKQGRERFRHLGLLTDVELEEALRKLE